MSELPAILVVDDEVRSLEAIRRILSEDFDVHIAPDTIKAKQILETEQIEVILCDQRMPDVSGIEFLKSVRQRWPEIVRMIISGYTEAHDIIDGINEAGIYQYITKPWHPQSLSLVLHNAIQLFRLQRENDLLAVEMRLAPSTAARVVNERKRALRKDYDFDDGIIRRPNSPMNAVCASLRQVAPFDIPVILTGESGTGKELAARALHYGSLRWNKPFVVENCGALPDQLLESELFGHKRGAFTGAVEDHQGLFERASGGTVFLDEIGEISPAFQVKLLRVLQEQEVRPLGGSRTRKIDVRVVAATNRKLEDEVRAGRFRADLYYRLAGSLIHLPPLRERRGDVSLLAEAILAQAGKKLGKVATGFTQPALERLGSYPWPGNVRELQNEVQHMLVKATGNGLLGIDLMSRTITATSPIDEVAAADNSVNLITGTLRDRIDALEANIIRDTLVRLHWNKSRTADELGLSRVGLRAKMQRYGLEKILVLIPNRIQTRGE
ncbi:sigma-54-dependent Fis family transcriptional regulator [Neorhizobium galegae]|uniref:Sigma-54-dependent Fis family transcriptional regulator n=1 Tax=Neorhizobium galegae TaxID=399 RepID=A0A6A1TJC7_NEOGA|nr:sigma-54 dependent transcriptional regulator [Neorhizobium galegae]KAB1082996.1 sigma-54-dependent Fis family transcriptional regulator [Neorhizobium galegae]